MHEPEPFNDPPRFLSGCVGPYGDRLLPVCCPNAASPIFGPQSGWPARALPHAKSTSWLYLQGWPRVWPLRRLACTDAKTASPHLITPVISRSSAVPRCRSSSVQASLPGLRLHPTGSCPALFLPVLEGPLRKTRAGLGSRPVRSPMALGLLLPQGTGSTSRDY
jgi:hypothetical protein